MATLHPATATLTQDDIRLNRPICPPKQPEKKTTNWTLVHLYQQSKLIPNNPTSDVMHSNFLPVLEDQMTRFSYYNVNGISHHNKFADMSQLVDANDSEDTSVILIAGHDIDHNNCQAVAQIWQNIREIWPVLHCSISSSEEVTASPWKSGRTMIIICGGWIGQII